MTTQHSQLKTKDHIGSSRLLPSRRQKRQNLHKARRTGLALKCLFVEASINRAIGDLMSTIKYCLPKKPENFVRNMNSKRAQSSLTTLTTVEGHRKHESHLIMKLKIAKTLVLLSLVK